MDLSAAAMNQCAACVCECKVAYLVAREEEGRAEGVEGR